ncbi:MAG TPA: outer membrane beta-barrel protein [Pseudolabrys sp.]|jgi:outer membrane immunogenic protein|nr:outer membrane beta-barrel protein [Pseudolabrys sp.]
MRKSSLTVLAAVIGLAAGQASAADLPRKAPAYVPPAPPQITWTGCYIGANVGGVFGRAKADLGFGGELSSDRSGFAGGGQIGCDYQFAGGWVFGVRNMFDGTSLNRDRTFFDPISGVGGTAHFKNNWFDTLTGRLGYAVAPSWLLYGQGGAAWAKNSADVTINGFDVGSVSRTRTGWTAGAGVEWMFAPNWSAFLEGNYMDFGSNNHNIVTPLVPVCATGCSFSTKTTAATVLVGVNYRFNWGKAPY